MQLDDLDWENETLRERRSKSARTHLFPLSRGVGQAILRYILEVQPPRPEGKSARLDESAAEAARYCLVIARYTGRRIERASGYGVPHVWGHPWDPDAFAAGRNLC